MTTLLTQIRNIDWNFPDSDKSNNVHNIHPYPAKFIPEIPRNLIKTLGIPKDTWVFDPFCGSGVTLVEAQNYGYPAIGVDLNPIACLISRVKTNSLEHDIQVLSESIIPKAKHLHLEHQVPKIPNLDHWFQKDIQQAISSLLSQISKIEDTASREALKLALSSILVRVSNQESDTRYAAIQKSYHAQDVFLLFGQTVSKIKQALETRIEPLPETHVLQKNVLHLTSKEIKPPIGMVITSPPYPNAYEYWLYHKYRMFWLGYDPLSVKEQEIGARAHYFKKNVPTVKDFTCQMEYVFNILNDVVVSGGYVCCVIGRSKIHGRIIDNAAIIEKIGKKMGYEKIAIIERVLSKSRKSFNLSHAKIKKEHLLIFRK